ncbi:MAG: hypothetical protein K2K96_09395 [Lachnospiraceae bacterium]|nr:hypothetical protein [Lachnospiraceae bacterium]
MFREDLGMLLFDNALEIVLVFDDNGVITYDNAAAREKLEYESGMCGLSINSVFPGIFQKEDGRQTVLPPINEIRRMTAYRKNQTCFPADVKILQEQKSGIFLCVANDVLEKEYLSRNLEQAKQEAEAALRVKSEFVANVTHELRTPVNGILGHIREMLPEEQEKEKLRKLHLIERCCEEMNKIINNILDFSKLEAGKFVLEPRRFHFRNMIDYVVANHKGRITEKGLDFFVTVSPSVPEYIVGDELRIVQILNNLLSNAQKFTSVGKITLEVVKTSQMKDSLELFFLVGDTGIGIALEDHDKLFQSFSQVDASTSRKYGGTGLGLSICRQLVELMGGSIDVQSEKGKGTMFSFSIWAKKDPEETDAESAVGNITMPKPVGAFGSGLLEDTNDASRYGTVANLDILQKNMSKLILSVEMENWEKAEMFMETIRQLTADAPQDVARAVLRLKMAIQKENYEKTSAGMEALKVLIEGQEG